jgi:ribonuclease P/MRP protein subunit POP5
MSTRRPRYRYIAFRLEGPRDFRREEFLEALRAASPLLALLAFDGASGLARTTNVEKDSSIRVLNSIDSVAGVRVRVRTVGTSGTIRAATERYLKPRNRAAAGFEKESL